MAEKKIVTLANLQTFKTQCDSTYATKGEVNAKQDDISSFASLGITNGMFTVIGYKENIGLCQQYVDDFKLSQFVNDAGFITLNDIPPSSGGTVTSVNNTSPDANGNVSLTIPTKTSDLTNDSGFITSAPANYTNSSLAPSQCTSNGFYYVASTTGSLSGADSNPFKQYHTSNIDFRILTTAHSANWLQQIATDFRTEHIYYRRRENGTTWTDWVKLTTANDLGDQVTYSYSNGTLTITSK